MSKSEAALDRLAAKFPGQYISITASLNQSSDGLRYSHIEAYAAGAGFGRGTTADQAVDELIRAYNSAKASPESIGETIDAMEPRQAGNIEK